MSRKVDRFRQFIANPLNIHNFECVIEGLDEYAIVVQSTAFPSERSRFVRLFIAGEPVDYPTVPENSHTWNVSLPESDTGEMRNRMEALRKKYWDQKTGAITVGLNNPYTTMTVRARDLNDNIVFSVSLKNAWVVGREDVNLNVSDPSQNWNWQYQIHFDYIEDSE